MAKKKKQELDGSGFGSFLGPVISRALTGAPEPTPELDTQAMQRTVERMAAPRKIKDLQAQIDQLRKQVHGRMRRGRPNLTHAVIARIKGDHPGFSVEDICKELDGKRGGVPLPEKFRKLGFSSWHNVWTDKKFRPRVKTEISRVRPAKPKKA